MQKDSNLKLSENSSTFVSIIDNADCSLCFALFDFQIIHFHCSNDFSNKTDYEVVFKQVEVASETTR